MNMKLQYLIITSALSVFLSLGFSQCSGTKNAANLSNTIDVLNEINPKAYYQNWVAGVRGGGSGTDVFIHKSLLENIVVDSIYFQNKVAKLNIPSTASNFFTASFRRDLNQLKKPGIETDEVKNSKINQQPIFPFELNDNEAVVSYLVKSDRRYLKITNMVKQESLAYPSAPRH